jgi:biotin transport system substrate-specific component
MLTKVYQKSEALQIAIGVAILFCCSQISIPIKPIPITMQSVGVLLIGLFYQRRQALITMLSYIALGAIGVPVFVNLGAYISLARPTTGYLVGFIAASIAMPLFREYIKKETSWTIFANCMVGSFCIYSFGIAWLAFFLGWQQAIAVGFLPFIIPGCIKAVILSQAVRHVRGKIDKNDQTSKKRAVTLIEMIVVMLLIAMITGALAYNYNSSLNEGKAFKTKEAISRIKTILALKLAEEPQADLGNWKNFVTDSPLAGRGNELLQDGWGGEFEVSVQDSEDGQEVIVSSKNYKSYLDKKRSK